MVGNGGTEIQAHWRRTLGSTYPPPHTHWEGGLQSLLTLLRLLKTPQSPASTHSLEPILLQGRRLLARGLLSM